MYKILTAAQTFAPRVGSLILNKSLNLSKLQFLHWQKGSQNMCINYLKGLWKEINELKFNVKETYKPKVIIQILFLLISMVDAWQILQNRL